MRKAPLKKLGQRLRERLLSHWVLHQAKDCLFWRCPGTSDWLEVLVPYLTSQHDKRQAKGVFEQPNSNELKMNGCVAVRSRISLTSNPILSQPFIELPVDP